MNTTVAAASENKVPQVSAVWALPGTGSIKALLHEPSSYSPCTHRTGQVARSTTTAATDAGSQRTDAG